MAKEFQENMSNQLQLGALDKDLVLLFRKQTEERKFKKVDVLRIMVNWWLDMDITEILLTLLLGAILVAGCSSVQSTVTFRDQKIVVGQSTDSIEKLLGQPDLATSARLRPWHLKVKKIDPWIIEGRYTIEWVYWDNPESLLLWLEGNAVQGIWLAETKRLK